LRLRLGDERVELALRPAEPLAALLQVARGGVQLAELSLALLGEPVQVAHPHEHLVDGPGRQDKRQVVEPPVPVGVHRALLVLGPQLVDAPLELGRGLLDGVELGAELPAPRPVVADQLFANRDLAVEVFELAQRRFLALPDLGETLFALRNLLAQLIESLFRVLTLFAHLAVGTCGTGQHDHQRQQESNTLHTVVGGKLNVSSCRRASFLPQGVRGKSPYEIRNMHHSRSEGRKR